MPERRAAHTTADALALLDELRESGGRVFLWVHYQDPHGPYTAPSDYRAPPGPPPAGVRDRRLPVFPARHIGFGGIPDYQQLGSERHSAVYRAAYHAEIRFLDAQLGAFFEAVRARGLWEETAIAVTADHGEGLGEEGHWFAHGELVAPAETAVPLLLRVPGRGAAVRDDLASLLDLLPTLLAVVGEPLAEPASAEAPGRDLLASGAEGRESALFQSNLQEGIIGASGDPARRPPVRGDPRTEGGRARAVPAAGRLAGTRHRTPLALAERAPGAGGRAREGSPRGSTGPRRAGTGQAGGARLHRRRGALRAPFSRAPPTIIRQAPAPAGDERARSEPSCRSAPPRDPNPRARRPWGSSLPPSPCTRLRSASPC